MALGEKIVEVGLAGASAAIATFAIYLWAETQKLNEKIDILRGEIASIERTGELEMLKITECRDIWQKIIQAEESYSSNVKRTSEDVFDKRGCNGLKALKGD